MCQWRSKFNGFYVRRVSTYLERECDRESGEQRLEVCNSGKLSY